MNHPVFALVALIIAANAIASDEDDTATSAKISKTFQLKLESNTDQCIATAALDYFQRGAEAQVETSIDTEDCPAASGDYVVKITLRSDIDGTQSVLDFVETWERTENLPIESIKRFAIGKDMELRKIRVRKLSCTCREESAAD